MRERLLGHETPLFRVLTPRWSYDPLSGAGAATTGGRFNRPGVEAVYLSFDAATALAEYQQDSPFLPSGTIASYLTVANSVFGVTNSEFGATNSVLVVTNSVFFDGNRMPFQGTRLI